LYYFYGDNLQLNDNPDSAAIMFDKGAAIDPANPLIKIGKAKLLLNEISIREAKNANDKDPNQDNLNRYQKAQENQAKAMALIDEATANAKDITVLVEGAEALIHYKTYDLDKAKILLDKALQMDPKKVEVLLLYGDIYALLSNGTLAADYYNRALDLNRKSARAIVSKGRLYKRATNNEGAAREFENAISIDSNYAPAHRELGESYIKLGKLAQAKEEYRKYLDLSKNNCGARIRYAYFLYIGKNYQDAINELNQVAERCDSNSQSLLRVLTYSYYENNEPDKAVITANRLFKQVAAEKRTITDLEYYGKALIKSSQDSVGIMLGIEQIQKALSMDPTRVDLYSVLADGYMKLKQYPNAIQVLNQKIATGKDVKVLDYYNLGSAYYYNKQFTAADSATQKVNEMTPTYATGWMLRARINSNIDSTSELGLAKPFYEKYIERAMSDSVNISKYKPGLIEAYGYLGYYYVLKNDKENGISFLKKKRDLLNPGDEERKKIDDAIDRLEKGPKKK
jgi:tetratricopeptide (TPR) repeat protein